MLVFKAGRTRLSPSHLGTGDDRGCSREDIVEVAGEGRMNSRIGDEGGDSVMDSCCPKVSSMSEEAESDESSYCSAK